MRSQLLLVLGVAALAACAGRPVRMLPQAMTSRVHMRVHGPSALAHSKCAAPNTAIPPNGAFVVCMNGR